MVRTISIANQKGGVGKTTTAMNLSAYLANLGHPTLLVDMDPQGNASSGLGFGKDEVDGGICDALMGFRSLGDVILETSYPDLHLVPATRSLVGAEVELVDLPDRESRLRMALFPAADRFSYVIIDCPPSLGLLTVNALACSDSVLIPLQAHYYALEGLTDLLHTIAAFKDGLNPALVREGILLTMAEPRTNLARDVEAQAREVFGDEVFKTIIPRNVRLAESPSFGQAILDYDPGCRGAVAYRELARELLQRHGRARSADSMVAS